MLLLTSILTLLPPFHSWSTLSRWEGERDPTTTVIWCNLPHLGASVFVRYGSPLPSPSLQLTDPIGYSLLYAISSKQNDAIVTSLNTLVSCPPSTPVNITGDFNLDGIVNSQDFYDFLTVFYANANNGASP